jgi:hypothetical protein
LGRRLAKVDKSDGGGHAQMRQRPRRHPGRTLCRRNAAGIFQQPPSVSDIAADASIFRKQLFSSRRV